MERGKREREREERQAKAKCRFMRTAWHKVHNWQMWQQRGGQQAGAGNRERGKGTGDKVSGGVRQ